MANNRYSESIEDKAFKALDEALQIDFSEEGVRSRTGHTPDATEANLSETSNPRAKQAQEEAARRAAAARNAAARAPEAPKGPPQAAANDTSKTAATILRSIDTGSESRAVRNATIFSVLWVIAGLGLIGSLYSPQIWQVSSLVGFLSLPGIIA